MTKTADALPHLWQGKLVRLRAMEPTDWAVYHAWRRDDNQERNQYFVPFPSSTEAVKRRALERSLKGPDGDNFRFVIVNQDDEVVGNLSTHDCDPRVGTFAFGINTRAGYRRRGYAQEAIRLVLRYYFRERRYQKCNSGAFAFNDASIQLHESLGFQHEGRIRRATYTDGEFHDLILFGLTQEEFDAHERQRKAAHPDG